ncbi:hypothetical protein [Trinickia sp.]|uniref:hypothetical protein n=1 Tax=Trinickia sp. TaxID=2571163 RepID=UPI003F7DE58A
MTATTNARAARVEERCSHVVVGYVMQHHFLAKRAIVVGAEVRWFPNEDEFQNMMGWKKYPDGPGVPHEGWPLDESPAPISVAPPAAAPQTPARPALTAPPSARLLESTEAALGVLAHELGCVYDVSIPHNAGWFVPGKPMACASAYDAIRGLVASLQAGGTVYRPSAANEDTTTPTVPAAALKQSDANDKIAQGALF